MDNAVALVESYLRVNGYFTVTEYPLIEVAKYGEYRTATDLDVLAFRFAGAGRLVPFEVGKFAGNGGKVAFAPDPQLGGVTDQAEMLIGEVKEGHAELNVAARDPVVLRAALNSQTLCLLQHVSAQTHCGHVVRLIAFGSLPPLSTGGKYTALSLGHVHEFLVAYIREHWNLLCHAQFKDPALGFEMILEKARRGCQQN